MRSLLLFLTLTATVLAQAPFSLTPGDIIDKQPAEEAQTDENDPAFLKEMRGEKAELDVRSRSAQANEELFYVNQNARVRGKVYEAERDIIGQVEHGDQVPVVSYYEDFSAEREEDQSWARIRLKNGREGYIPEKYLQKSKPAPPRFLTRKPMAYIPKKYYVSASYLRMREEPTVHSPRITTLRHGAEVDVQQFSEEEDYVEGQSAKWAFVDWEGYEGWVFSGYLVDHKPGSENENVQEDPNHIHSGAFKYVKSRILHLRDEPSKYGAIVGILRHRTRVRITERSDIEQRIMGIKSIWVKIAAGDTTGWVYGGFLTEKMGNYVGSDDIDVPFIFPINQVHFTRRMGKYGPRWHPVKKRPSFHTGIDVGGARGEPIYAAGDGKVVRTMKSRAYGNLTVIQHDNGLYTYYAHQIRFKKKEGETVKAGDVVGYCGSTGFSTGPHLHFEVRKGLWKAHMDPMKYLPAGSR